MSRYQEICEENNISLENTIRRYVRNIQERSEGFSADCPVCEGSSERTFSFYRLNGIFKCFRCDARGVPTKGGNAIDFLIRIGESKTFTDALNTLGIEKGPNSKIEKTPRIERALSKQNRKVEKAEEKYEGLESKAYKFILREWERGAGYKAHESPYFVNKIKYNHKYGNILDGCEWKILDVYNPETKEHEKGIVIRRENFGWDVFSHGFKRHYRKEGGGKIGDNPVYITSEPENKFGPIYLAEGLATACSVKFFVTIEHEMIGCDVCYVGSATQLKAGVAAIRKRFPRRKIIIAADNDREIIDGSPVNAGLDRALEAARTTRNCDVACPTKRGDFNDFLLDHDDVDQGRFLLRPNYLFFSKEDMTPEGYIQEDLALELIERTEKKQRFYIKSPCGSGKNYAIATKVFEHGAKEGLSMVHLVPRQKLAMKASNDLKHLDFTCYLDVNHRDEGLEYNFNRLVLCSQSIRNEAWRPKEGSYDIVIVDEVTEICSQFWSSISTKPLELYEALIDRIRNSQTAFLLDANLTVEDMTLMSDDKDIAKPKIDDPVDHVWVEFHNIRPEEGRKVEFIFSETKGEKSKHAYFYHLPTVIEEIKGYLDNGEKVYAFCCTKSDADQVFSVMPEDMDKMLVTSETGNDEVAKVSQKAFDLLVASPAMSTGYSIPEAVGYDRVVVLQNQYSPISSEGIYQGAKRVRSDVPITIFTSEWMVSVDDPETDFIKNIYDITRVEEKITRLTGSYTERINADILEIMRDMPFYRLYDYRKKMEAKDRANPVESLVDLWAGMGAKISYKEIDRNDQNQSEIKSHARTSKVKEIMIAKDIYPEMDEGSIHRNSSTLEKRAYIYCKAKKYYGESPGEEEIELFLSGHYKKVKNFSTLFQDQDVDRASRLIDLEENNDGTNSAMPGINRYIRVGLTKRLGLYYNKTLEKVTKSGTKHVSWSSREVPEDILEWVEEEHFGMSMVELTNKYNGVPKLKDLSNKSIVIWIGNNLSNLGISTEGERVQDDEGRYRLYKVDESSLVCMNRWAKNYNKHLLEQLERNPNSDKLVNEGYLLDVERYRDTIQSATATGNNKDHDRKGWPEYLIVPEEKVQEDFNFLLA